ncbi:MULTISPECIES: type II secretion system secretin GspD [Sphingomonas]|uniref:Type II secretion system protein GspD n=1 Tax=Sphingomonas hankookensis TaxID=563996 RepID=A0ABR5Y8I3_9SPHN|nr:MULTISPECIES: type II secretion system secretin GspD [Sphingomonas]KZE09198.1 type II secretion system protein GspD [Sphingomonas hankookensis]WCP73086.1 type II secretion system secretin GspD [Sphingomonas hankookensis]
MRHRFASAFLSLALAATSLSPAIAQTQAADIVVNMRGVEIADVADQISRITGRTLILDPSVKGQVTVTSAEPLSPAGVWELFQSVLRANGFAAVRSGSAWRIIPQANAVRDGGVRTRGVGGQELTTRMVRLSNVPSADAARIVRPLVASFGSVEPLTQPNAIVVTDYADNVRRIEALARSLDGGGGSTFATITLTNGNAADIATAMQAVLGEGGARVAGDPRSNTILVRGTPASVAEARRIAQSLDARGGSATMSTRVFRLNFADAESVTDVLRGILGQQQSATNPVARSLSTVSQRNNAGQALSGLIASGGTNAGALAGAAGGLGATGVGGSISTVGQNQQTTPAQGFTTPDITVQPAPDINAVVVRGTPTAIAQIERLIPDLDVRRPQVLIEAAIAEITGQDAEQLAVQIGTAGAALTQVSGAGTSFDNGGASLGRILGVLGVPAAGLLSGGLSANIGIGNDFSILVQALSTSTKANLLSTPQITVLDNKLGEFVVAQEVPFVTGSILTGNGTANPYTTIERKDVGITLRVLPRINAGDTIRLEVSQEASSIAPTQVSGAADIITNKRSANTTVLADNGQTIVLGGLTSDDYQRLRSQVPILGSLPVIGELFKGRTESRQKRTLFVFLKPTILRDGADASAAARARYDRLRRDEVLQGDKRSLLLNPPAPRLTMEIDGIY